MRITGTGSHHRFRLAGSNLLNLPRLNARGAHSAVPNGPAFDDSDALQVGIPATLGEVMGMTDGVPNQGLFSADFTTSGHDDDWF